MPSDLIFVDTETTGTDPHVHEIIEIAAIRVRHRDWTTIATLEHRVFPVDLARAQPRALEINGFSPELWHDAVSLRDALYDFAVMAEDGILVGHNVAFDRDFLFAAYESTGLARPRVARYMIDTVAYAHILDIQSGCGHSLNRACHTLGISNEGEHRAMADAVRAMQVYRRITRAASQIVY